MDQLASIMGCVAAGALLPIFWQIHLLIKEIGALRGECDMVIKEANANVKAAAAINQSLVQKIEILEDTVKSLDFWRTQGKK